MTGADIACYSRDHQLLGASVVLNPSIEYGRDGVRGGVVIATSAEGSTFLLAIHGRLDDRLWVGPGNVASVEPGTWTLDASHLRPSDRAALTLDLSYGVLAILPTASLEAA